MPFLAIRNGHVFDPRDRGFADVLIGSGRILAVGSDLQVPAAWGPIVEIDARNCYVVPGFLDPHVHIAGGGGEGGPATRNFDIQLADIVQYGVTTVVGALGVDSTSKGTEGLLARAQGLEIEGITAFVWAGSYLLPSRTLTGDVVTDVAYVDKVLGVKLAIADHRGSQPTTEEIAKLAAKSRMGGLLASKPGLLHLHLGHGQRTMQQLFEIAASTEVPITQFYPTHVNRSRRHLDQAEEFVRLGGWADVTAGIAPEHGFTEAIKPSAALRALAESSDPNRITMSSDANGNMIEFDGDRDVRRVVVQSIRHLLREWQDLIRIEGLSMAAALQVVTSNTAARLGLARRKGRVAAAYDADVLVVSEDALEIRDVVAKGALLKRDCAMVVAGTFEETGTTVDVLRAARPR